MSPHFTTVYPFLLMHNKREQLARQITHNETEIRKAEEEERLLGKLEQTHLAEDIREERKRLWEETKCSQKAYKSALDYQIDHKPERIPRAQDNDGQTLFGAHHYDPVKLEEARERALAVHRAQIKAAQERKDLVKLKNDMESAQETDLLRRVHHDLICDGVKRREAQEAMRRYMESEWTKAVQEKKDRERLEKVLANQPSAMVLQDQCATTQRCFQCKRRLENIGQTNLIGQPSEPGMSYVM
ncbi:hypothetical protein FGIG_05792 [Fasciola gigantica]|uniref:Uncharacterized protein n=1 Tax=Fasciola gigantica TaxID=46835 RepID=A0A504YC46_FASGI|nr:hypothetical protein FGIG_05792 [Fasciola gigantica]